MAAHNMYRIGDFVYVDVGPTEPYAVRRIDELQKAATGNVEVEVMVYARRIDLPQELISVADDNLADHWDEAAKKYPTQVHERELFLAKRTEKISATQIRGKCTVCILHKAESLFSYIKTEDAFFYSLVYDANNKSLFEDRGEIKIGSSYQAEVPLATSAKKDTRKFEDLEKLVWSPENELTDKQIDQFLVLARSVGTFARAVDEASTLKQPSLHMSAAAASRDVTLFNAMGLLHSSDYNFAQAALSLVKDGSPRLCSDQMEEWTTAEAALFEEAMEKHGKTFNDIWTDYLPWKTVKNLVDYYYTWKTTDRYVQQKRLKAADQETKLKQVYVPDYTKHGDGSIPGHLVQGAICICCRTTQSTSWYEMPGAQLIGMANCRICHTCWNAYRKYSAMSPGGMNKDLGGGGGIKLPGGIKGKKATTLYLMPTLVARIARKLPNTSALNLRRLGRKPFRGAVPQDAVREDCVKLVSDKSPDQLKSILKHRKFVARKDLAGVTVSCGYNDPTRPEWLIPMAKDKLPQPEKEAFPRSKAGRAGPPAVMGTMNRIKAAAVARGVVRNGTEVKNAPEDIFFRSTKKNVEVRKNMTSKAVKKLARRPTKVEVGR